MRNINLDFRVGVYSFLPSSQASNQTTGGVVPPHSHMYRKGNLWYHPSLLELELLFGWQELWQQKIPTLAWAGKETETLCSRAQ